jgi:hypothetical protein
MEILVTKLERVYSQGKKKDGENPKHKYLRHLVVNDTHKAAAKYSSRFQLGHRVAVEQTDEWVKPTK